MDLEKMILDEVSQIRKTNSSCFLLYAVSSYKSSDVDIEHEITTIETRKS